MSRLTYLILFILLFIFSFPSKATLAISDISEQVTLPSINTKAIPLRIAVAANFTPVLKELLVDFTQQTGIESQIISGASGAMFLQIKHGAPFDIFLSADKQRPMQLEHDGLIIKESRKTYALGQLALYSASTTFSQGNLQSYLKTPTKYLAIANPDIAPYGKAAKETLQHLGLWESYQSKLITGINIGQTFTQLQSKAVNLGIVANSQLVINHLSGVVIPNTYHQPIEQQLVIINTSKNKAAAQALSHFLLSADSQEKIISYGYAARKYPHYQQPNQPLDPQLSQQISERK